MDSLLPATLVEDASQPLLSPVKPETISSLPVTPVTSKPEVKIDSSSKKLSKEPVQIIRKGRVITLPPIEAPATRSKRLQAKTTSQDKEENKPQQLQQQEQHQQHQQHQLPKINSKNHQSQKHQIKHEQVKAEKLMYV